jgi:hypothetical protein
MFLAGSLLTGVFLWGAAYAAHFETYRWEELSDQSGVRQVLELDAGLLPGGGLRSPLATPGPGTPHASTRSRTWSTGRSSSWSWARAVDARASRSAGLARYQAPDPNYDGATREDTRYVATTWIDLGAGRPVVGAWDGAAAPRGLERPGPERDRVGLHREPGLDGGGALMRRTLLPVVLAVLGLAGAGLATLSLHRAASGALQRATEERLRGAGATAARTLEQPASSPTPGGSVRWWRPTARGRVLLDAQLTSCSTRQGPPTGRWIY